jgi:KaiC/GvpD/RAD55 family RecA-like ATPase
VEHAADGIIRMDLDEYDGELYRSLIVWKMRGTKHDMRRHPFDITDKGIIVYYNKVLRIKGGRAYAESLSEKVIKEMEEAAKKTEDVYEEEEE